MDAAQLAPALRKMLGNLMRQMDEMMGKIPDPMGKAERSMRDAEGARLATRTRFEREAERLVARADFA